MCNNKQKEKKLLEALEIVDEFVKEEKDRLEEGRSMSSVNKKRLNTARKIINETIINNETSADTKNRTIKTPKHWKLLFCCSFY